MKYHILHNFRTSTPIKKKFSEHFKDKLKLLTNFDANLMSCTCMYVLFFICFSNCNNISHLRLKVVVPCSKSAHNTHWLSSFFTLGTNHWQIIWGGGYQKSLKNCVHRKKTRKNIVCNKISKEKIFCTKISHREFQHNNQEF